MATYVSAALQPHTPFQTLLDTQQSKWYTHCQWSTCSHITGRTATKKATSIDLCPENIIIIRRPRSYRPMNMSVSSAGARVGCSCWGTPVSGGRCYSAVTLTKLPKNSRFNGICLNSSLLGPSMKMFSREKRCRRLWSRIRLPPARPGPSLAPFRLRQCGIQARHTTWYRAHAPPTGEDKDPAVPCGVLGFNPAPPCLPEGGHYTRL